MTIALFIAFTIFVALNTPISLALGLASLAGLMYEGRMPLILIPQKMFTGVDSFVLLAVPLFVLAGNLMDTGGISRRLIAVATRLVGHIRGGLGQVVIVSMIFFSGLSGSSTADTAAVGSVCIPAMVRKGYRRELATSIVAAAGGMGILIPPCLNMVVYAIIAEVSIAGLFLAGFLPGFLMGFCLMVYMYLRARKENYPTEPKASWREVMVATKEAVFPLLTPVIIMGGILSGVFTVTESAAIAVAYAFVLSVFAYKELKFSQLPEVLISTASTTGVVMMLMGMASIFGWILAHQRIPHLVGESISSISTRPWVFLLIVNVLFLIVGCFMDPLPAIVILVPILLPVALQLGINPIHFGIILIANLGIGFITPPVGNVLFVACSIGEVSISSVIVYLLPFIAVMIVALGLITYIPEISLFLPRLLGFL
jgi:C4-dicarboxylate transporter, DctM subunit